MSCSGSHLGITINIKNTKIDAQFRFNQCKSFREEDISVFSRYGQNGIFKQISLKILCHFDSNFGDPHSKCI
jgi:hypothetical protein